MTNKQKHQQGVSLVSDYLIGHKIEHLIFQSDKEMDLYLPKSSKSLKIFSNFSKSRNLKISKNYTFKANITYLVVSPSSKNNVGFTCIGGTREEMENSIKVFNTSGSPKNIQTDRLKSMGIKKIG